MQLNHRHIIQMHCAFNMKQISKEKTVQQTSCSELWDKLNRSDILGVCYLHGYMNPYKISVKIKQKNSIKTTPASTIDTKFIMFVLFFVWLRVWVKDLGLGKRSQKSFEEIRTHIYLATGTH